MKKNILMTTAFLILSLSAGFAKIQGQDKKAEKAEKRLELQKEIEGLIDSKQFLFIATRALPMWGTSINLIPNSNYLKFDPVFIESYMPFFGNAYSTDYNVDPGVKFQGKPDEFEIKKLKKDKGYDIRVKVSLPSDTFDIYLHVSLEGSANLTISSYRRSSISYFGSISGTVQPAQKEKGAVT
jgi:hypothetical protein